MEPSDEALVLACRRGDVQAWETLVFRYERLISDIARRSGLTPEQTADVSQHVFATLVEYLPRIDQPARIRSWLATTARREAWRIRRRGRSTLPLSGTGREEDEGDEAADNAPLPDEILLRLEEEHMVRTAMASLDERCRTLLTLLFYRSDPPSYADIAARFGISERTISPIRARCLQKLLALLKAADF